MGKIFQHLKFSTCFASNSTNFLGFVRAYGEDNFVHMKGVWTYCRKHLPSQEWAKDLENKANSFSDWWNSLKTLIIARNVLLANVSDHLPLTSCLHLAQRIIGELFALGVALWQVGQRQHQNEYNAVLVIGQHLKGFFGWRERKRYLDGFGRTTFKFYEAKYKLVFYKSIFI